MSVKRKDRDVLIGIYHASHSRVPCLFHPISPPPHRRGLPALTPQATWRERARPDCRATDNAQATRGRAEARFEGVYRPFRQPRRRWSVHALGLQVQRCSRLRRPLVIQDASSAKGGTAISMSSSSRSCSATSAFLHPTSMDFSSAASLSTPHAIPNSPTIAASSACADSTPERSCSLSAPRTLRSAYTTTVPAQMGLLRA